MENIRETEYVDVLGIRWVRQADDSFEPECLLCFYNSKNVEAKCNCRNDCGVDVCKFHVEDLNDQIC